MRSNDIFEYAKTRPYHLLIFIAALFLSITKDFTFEGLGLFVVNFIIEYLHYSQRVVFLHKQGLTEKEYTDKKFTKEWAETRQSGLTRYCFFDGGIIKGSILSIFVGAVFFSSGILGDVSKDFSSMMELIWKSWVISFMIAVAANRVAWKIQENRFVKLTAITGMS